MGEDPSNKLLFSKVINEEIPIQECNIVIDRSGAYHVAQFSDEVHDSVNHNMQRTMIIHLLGRTIGYLALWNKINILWQPMGRFQLIDLDNDYFLVRFESDRDYTNVLTEGPWVNFGSYLTVQPWSHSFDTTDSHPSQVIIWIRLSRLPYRYYTKALFWILAAEIGKVNKIDYNTRAEGGKFARVAVTVDLNKLLLPCIGIDRFVQRLEYDGLQNIYFQCVLYEHVKDQCTL
ncbi:uncharacterized protein LOC120152846 [Hibiscus syriacus]|uniref:uncharacterized protein LOC120152846 n=1 Tax=Hibiscus syriacus TaxID=106335 RepID=UPI001922689A|nr:uncharacterized protein LOC120152846 [Hibiscus syriacus]